MEVRKKQTYTNDSSKATKTTRGSQKAKVEQKEMVKSVPQQKIWRSSTDTQKEIQNSVIRPADRGRVEADPSQGWGSKLNNDVLYNGLRQPNFQKAYSRTMARKKK